MSKKRRMLTLAPNLKLPAEDAVESVFAIIGKRKRGKTGFVRVLLEEIHAAGLPFVAFDPVGVLWGLRSSADGKGKGLPILVVGGAYGDLPIDRRAGADVAKGIVQQNVSAVIDFSTESKACFRQFLRDFADTLYRINKTSRHVVVEEAPEVLPQRLRPDLAATFEAMERLFSRGRNRGIGGSLITQRSATLNKDVASQADHLVNFGVTAPQDRKALGEWVEGKADPEMLKRFLGDLASLKPGEGWFWSPEQYELFVKFRTRQMRTFHPDRTHLRRMGLSAVEPVRTDVSGLVTSLSAVLDRLNTTPEPKGRKKGPEKIPPASSKDAARLAQALAERDELKGRVRELRAHIMTLEKQLGRFQRTLPGHAMTLLNIAEDLKALGATETPEVPTAIPQTTKRNPSTAPAPRAPRAPHNGVPKGHDRILAALRFHPRTRAELALRAGYHHAAGGFNNYLSELRTRGYIEGNGANLQLTAAGAQIPVGELPDAFDYWCNKLGKAERLVMEYLREQPDGTGEKQEIAEGAGYEVGGGGFNNALSRLRRRGIIEGSGTLTLASWMMD